MRLTFLYLGTLVLFYIAEIVYFRAAEYYGIVDRPSRRGSSDSVVLRGGGIIFPIAAAFLFIMDGFDDPLFIAGLMLVSALSFIDDIKSLSPKLRLPIQFVAIVLLLVQLLLTADYNVSPTAAVVFFIAGLIVCTGAINIFNFMDGINGITGGYSLVVLLAILFIFRHNPIGGFDIARMDLPRSIYDLAIFAVLADIVFCFFNFRKHARCFAGDVGSVSMAFIIIYLLGYIIVQTQNFSWLAFLVVYGVDGCLTILHRIMLHENITKPHRKHAFQLMANELHISHTTVSLIYMALQAVCCAAFVLLPGYPTLVAEIAILSLAYILFMKKYYHLHVESGNA